MALASYVYNCIIKIVFLLTLITLCVSSNRIRELGTINDYTIIPWEFSNNVTAKEKNVDEGVLLINEPECAILKRLCNEIEFDDLTTLECVQSLGSSQIADLTKECQHIIWTHTEKLINDQTLRPLLLQPCAKEDIFIDCDHNSKHSTLLTCLIDHKKEIVVPSCYHTIQRLEKIANINYELNHSYFKQNQNVHHHLFNSDEDRIRVKRSQPQPIFAPVPLISEPECTDALRRLCNEVGTDDLAVLECIQTFRAPQIAELSEQCQHVIWTHTKDLISNNNLRLLLRQPCAKDSIFTECDRKSIPNTLLMCLIDHRDSILPSCHDTIQRLEWVVASDYRLVTPFINQCEKDIEIYKCGRLEHSKEKLSQGKTLMCLQNRIENLTQNCQKEVLHLSEIQSDNVKLDRQLYMACATDQLRFCPDLRSGSDILKCLMQHKIENTMSQKCYEHLTRRQKLIARDYRISRGLARACKEDIKASHCRKGISDDKDIRLAQILLCLEGVIRNGTKVTPDCRAEMLDHRKILLEDFHLSPEIVNGCADDISTFCNGLEAGGKTIHCLMEHARPKKRRDRRVSVTCLRALEDLVRQTDVGEDWRVDPVLREACKPVVDSACREVRGGDARVMSCLMDKLGTDHMNQQCETALVQIQYFIARDFKLDPQLYRNCQDDAVRLCHAKKSWYERGEHYDPERGPLVLPCLYRNAYHSETNKIQLRPACYEEIRRVMRQRAISVDLKPEIEEVCIDELALRCFDKPQRGEEMQCLQNNLDDLASECKQVISRYIEDEAAYVELNPVIRKVCRSMMERFCEAELKLGKDQGNLMECLIAHKNDHEMREEMKCRAAVEHFQLISLKDYHFTYKFKEACKFYVKQYCGTARTKSDVISCLSERIRNSTIDGIRNTISKECRQQVRTQLLQQRENIDFDPKLQKDCEIDIAKHCSDLEHGLSNVLQCLQNLPPKQLSPKCHKSIFNIKRQEMIDNSIDYALITMCNGMTKMFCHDSDPAHVLECLKNHREDPVFDPKCKLIVVQRMIEQNMDYRLNPALQKSCQPDIKKFCHAIIVNEPEDEELNGKVIKCLKKKFREAKLTGNCESQMSKILREQALNYNLNPLIQTVCENEIKLLCKPSTDKTEETKGEVEECLKNALLNKRIFDKMCKIEIANMIEEAKADIHVDPLLQQACSVDLLKYCNDVLQGAGRHLKCLQNVMSNKNTPLQSECQTMLQKRMEMFQFAQEIVPPEDLNGLYNEVLTSPSKRYFIIVAITFVGFIFVSGLFCGRVTRRAKAMKNK